MWKDQCLLLGTYSVLVHLTGKQCVGVEHAVLQKVGYHVPGNTQFYLNFSLLRQRIMESYRLTNR